MFNMAKDERCRAVESWVLVLPKEHIGKVALTEKWLARYYTCLESLNLSASSWLIPSIHVLVPAAETSCLPLCRVTYYLLMWILRRHQRRAVHLGCLPYECAESEIRQLTAETFLYTLPSGWSTLWSTDFRTRFVDLCLPDVADSKLLAEAGAVPVIRTICSSIPQLAAAYTAPPTVPTMLCFGGSFDGLHPGHIATLNDLIQLACQTSSNKLLAIAISDDATTQRKDESDMALPFKYRRQQVLKCMCLLLQLMNFRKTIEVRCDKKQLSLHLAVPPRINTALRIISSGWDTIIALFERDTTTLTIAITDLDKDGVGLAAEVGDLDAAFVTPDTLRGGHKVNQMREARALPKLDLLVSPLMWPVDQLLSHHTKVDEKISSRFYRAKFHEYWCSDQHCANKLDPQAVMAVQRRNSFSHLCLDLGLTDSQKRILLRCVVFPVHLYATTRPRHSDWKLPVHTSVCSSQAEVNSEFPDSGASAIRAANDFVALFLDDEKGIDSRSIATTAESLDEDLHHSRGVCLLECVKGNE
eukprot:Gregarina_sp_Pseudo_9__1768@NODE_21_length_5816_cov_43_641856_g19_i0_p2_GENE_NODE_21_length_5816_cov_43_641856_g19_i0NODE_21_length_5816_cov_43_641856_g19_i0_p2_ORF_typecomplete_len529_score127_67CTP_transf_like/PF01467_26/0_00025FAD_syn/PF06574_12/0_038_NODE_21_length_5816_cov_43_641856_g19_i041685754